MGLPLPPPKAVSHGLCAFLLLRAEGPRGPERGSYPTSALLPLRLPSLAHYPGPSSGYEYVDIQLPLAMGRRRSRFEHVGFTGACGAGAESFTYQSS